MSHFSCEYYGEVFGRGVNESMKLFLVHTDFTVINELFTRGLFCSI